MQLGTGDPAAVTGKPQSVTQPFTHSHGHCNQCQAEPKICSPGMSTVTPLRVEFGSCPSSHLWRWASTAPIVWEIGIMPLYLEARDLVTILTKREECSSVFSPGRWGWIREGRLSERFIESQNAMVLNIQLIPLHTAKPFFYSDKCCHLDQVRKILVSAAGPFLKSPLHAGSLGQTPPSL